MTVRRVLIAAAALGAIGGWPVVASLGAADYGQMGQTFPIVEDDLLAVIEAKLRHLEATGGIEALQRQMQQQAVASVRRPKPVSGIGPTLSRREWLFDPSMVVEDDIRDQKGNLIAGRGQRVNPLQFVEMRQALVFVNGDSPLEVDWAVANYTATNAKIVFVGGSPFDLMKPYQRRFYFDQGGTLTAKFGIAHTPAVVVGAGEHLKVTEVPIARGGS